MKALAQLNVYFKRYKWMLILGILFITISNFFGVLAPGLIRNAFDSIGEWIAKANVEGMTREVVLEGAMKAALWYAFMYMIYTLLKGLFLFFTRQTIIVMSRLIEYDMKNDIYKKYQELSLSFYRRNNTGDLMNRISEDVSRVRMYLGPAVMYITNLAVLFVLVIYRMLDINATLTLYVLAPLPVMAFLVYFVSKKINQKSEAVQEQQSTLTTHAQEAFSGIRVVKSYGREKDIQDAFRLESELYKTRVLSLVRTDALFAPIITLLIGLSTVLTIYIGSRQAILGEISVGTIAEFVVYVNMLTWPFATVGWVSSLIQRASASQQRINEFLNETPEIQNKVTEQHELQGKIEFRNVSFTYPESGIKALQNVSFSIEPGQTLAIIGKTGSGKSTVSTLVARLFDATSGDVLIDSTRIDQINLDKLRSSIGYVPQDVFLFSDTIANNISFGLKDNITRERIEQAAKDAVIYDNIMEFKEGFETVVGERGVTLSGGQKQRVSIARAIIREPKILIFDDCLSAVDTETEDQILKNLRRIMQGRTSILVSHRVSTVRHADKIIVLQNGSIAEEGTHQALIDKKGIYFDLYRKQLLEDEKIV
jgi:ATP-binding cassette subfamily B protein